MARLTELRKRVPPWVAPAGIVAGGVLLGGLLVAFAMGGSEYSCPASLPPDACQVAERLAKAAQVATIDDGLVPFGTAVARRESRWNTGAINAAASEADAACDLYNDTKNSLYEDNDYPAARWCFGSGGLFGFLPATGLKPEVFRDKDPYLIFDPAASTAMFVDFVVRIVRDYFDELPASARNWLAVRRAMASLGTMRDWREEGERARGVRQRLAEDLAAIGADPDLMYETPTIGNYPGAGEVWDALSGPFAALA